VYKLQASSLMPASSNTFLSYRLAGVHGYQTTGVTFKRTYPVGTPLSQPKIS